MGLNGSLSYLYNNSSGMLPPPGAIPRFIQEPSGLAPFQLAARVPGRNEPDQTAHTAMLVQRKMWDGVDRYIRALYGQRDQALIDVCPYAPQLEAPQFEDYIPVATASIDDHQGLQILMIAFAPEKRMADGTIGPDMKRAVTARKDGVPYHMILSADPERFKGIAIQENAVWPVYELQAHSRDGGYAFDWEKHDKLYTRILSEAEHRAEQLAIKVALNNHSAIPKSGSDYDFYPLEEALFAVHSHHKIYETLGDVAQVPELVRVDHAGYEAMVTPAVFRLH